MRACVCVCARARACRLYEFVCTCAHLHGFPFSPGYFVSPEITVNQTLFVSEQKNKNCKMILFTFFPVLIIIPFSLPKHPFPFAITLVRQKELWTSTITDNELVFTCETQMGATPMQHIPWSHYVIIPRTLVTLRHYPAHLGHTTSLSRAFWSHYVIIPRAFWSHYVIIPCTLVTLRHYPTHTVL